MGCLKPILRKFPWLVVMTTPLNLMLSPPKGHFIVHSAAANPSEIIFSSAEPNFPFTAVIQLPEIKNRQQWTKAAWMRLSFCPPSLFWVLISTSLKAGFIPNLGCFSLVWHRSLHIKHNSFIQNREGLMPSKLLFLRKSTEVSPSQLCSFFPCSLTSHWIQALNIYPIPSPGTISMAVHGWHWLLCIHVPLPIYNPNSCFNLFPCREEEKEGGKKSIRCHKVRQKHRRSRRRCLQTDFEHPEIWWSSIWPLVLKWSQIQWEFLVWVLQAQCRRQSHD